MRRHVPSAGPRSLLGNMALGQVVACPHEYLVRHMAFFPDAALGLSAGAVRCRARGPSVFPESRHEGERDAETWNDRVIFNKNLMESAGHICYDINGFRCVIPVRMLMLQIKIGERCGKEGKNRMRRNRNKTVYILAAWILLISGMYFEPFKADPVFTCAPARAEASHISSADSGMAEEYACTAEMLGIRGNTEVLHTGRPAGPKRDIRISPDFLCQNVYFPYEGKSCTYFEEICTASGNQRELVTDYIHRSDGKKRI